MRVRTGTVFGVLALLALGGCETVGLADGPVDYVDAPRGGYRQPPPPYRDGYDRYERRDPRYGREGGTATFRRGAPADDAYVTDDDLPPPRRSPYRDGTRDDDY